MARHLVLAAALAFTLALAAREVGAAAAGSRGLTAEAALAQGKRAAAAARYGEALKLLTTAVAAARAAGNKPLLVRILLLTGVVHYNMGSQEKGKAAFIRAVRLDPKAALPADSSPKLLWVFGHLKRRQAKSKGRPTTAVPRGGAGPAGVPSTGGRASSKVIHQPPRYANAGQPIGLEVRIEGPVVRLTLNVREAGEVAFAPVALSPLSGRQGVYQALVLVRATGPERVARRRLEYYIVGFGRGGQRLAAMGSKQRPMFVPIRGRVALVPAPTQPPARSSRSIVTRWWFWTGVGVLVAGAATATALALRPGPKEHTIQVSIDLSGVK